MLKAILHGNFPWMHRDVKDIDIFSIRHHMLIWSLWYNLSTSLGSLCIQEKSHCSTAVIIIANCSYINCWEMWRHMSLVSDELILVINFWCFCRVFMDRYLLCTLAQIVNITYIQFQILFFLLEIAILKVPCRLHSIKGLLTCICQG